MILHLIRHPKPLVEPGICYGRLDIPAENANSVAERLRAELPPGLPVWSSPLRRCRELAECLHPQPVFDERLAEMDFGLWEGRPWDAIPRAELDAWAADVAGYAPPGGESARQLQQRVLQGVRQIVSDELVLVTHSGVIRVLVAWARRLPATAWLQIRPAYAEITRLLIDERRLGRGKLKISMHLR